VGIYGEQPKGVNFQHEVPARDSKEEEEENNDDQDIEPIEPPVILEESFPVPPHFEPYRHRAPEHSRIIHLPDDFSTNYGTVEPRIPFEDNATAEADSERGHRVTPGLFFKLFFTPEVFAELAENTNNYADMKRKSLLATTRGRRWQKTSAGELMIFIGLFIYMGAHKAMRAPLYWNKNDEFPTHEISRYMSQYRFEQLKRYFHVSPVNPNMPLPA